MKVELTDLVALGPLWVILGTGLALLLLEVFSSGKDRSWGAYLAVFGSAIALVMTVGAISEPARGLFVGKTGVAALRTDALGQFASLVVIGAGLLTCLMSPGYVERARCASGEYYALILFAVSGMIVMVMSTDLITMFLGLEIMSIAVYVLAGLRRNDPRSPEASLKYFLMGAFATGFLLFGIAFTFGATQSVSYDRIATFAKSPLSEQRMLLFGIVLLLIGFGFKIAAVPFHVWAPDVYEGAPTPITGFMAVGVKAAAFVALVRVVGSALSPGGASANAEWVELLRVLAVLTILGGNIMAAVQRNVKRMLAYSSISHAGYALIGVVAVALGKAEGGSALVFYLGAYAFMTLGAFGVLAFLERKEGGPEAERFGAFSGIGYQHPAIGLAMTIFMAALAGMPPTGGFVGKLYLFKAALAAGETGLVIVGVVGSVISVYYYLRVVVAFYMREVPDPGPLPSPNQSRPAMLGVGLAAVGILMLGAFPSRVVELAKLAVSTFG
ncbi:MAG: NADH-quinone oxidoreductase subunit N [Deltaproteobacteria bacterium]|nr:NADH-quinone oxidoreductase subunit N [Deltaproteobacteria bacterium]